MCSDSLCITKHCPITWLPLPSLDPVVEQNIYQDYLPRGANISCEGTQNNPEEQPIASDNMFYKLLSHTQKKFKHQFTSVFLDTVFQQMLHLQNSSILSDFLVRIHWKIT